MERVEVLRKETQSNLANSKNPSLQKDFIEGTLSSTWLGNGNTEMCPSLALTVWLEEFMPHSRVWASLIG